MLKKEHQEYIKGMYGIFCQNISIKFWATVSYGVFSFFFDNTRVLALVALLFLIIFDFITGVLAAKKNNEEIKSAKIFRTALKILLYFLMVASGHIAELGIGFNFFLDETIMVFLSVTELISILENVGRLGFGIPQKLLNKLESLRNSE